MARKQEAGETRWETFLSHTYLPFLSVLTASLSCPGAPHSQSDGLSGSWMELCVSLHVCFLVCAPGLGPAEVVAGIPFAFGLFWQLRLPTYLFVVFTLCSLTAGQWGITQWQVYINSP